MKQVRAKRYDVALLPRRAYGSRRRATRIPVRIGSDVGRTARS
jgi:hypothetical protein